MEREELRLTAHTASEREGVSKMLASKRKPMEQKTDTPQPERMLRWFEYEHLPAHLQAVSRPFGEMAKHICDTIRPGPERTVGLRKLLEAKDATVRAYLEQPGYPSGPVRTPNSEKAAKRAAEAEPEGSKDDQDRKSRATQADITA